MKRFLVVAAMLFAAACATQDAAPQPGRTAYVGGFIWDGERFAPGALVVEDGRFVDAAPSTAAEQVSLDGAFLVPPFCEAHNHNLGDAIAAHVVDGLRNGAVSGAAAGAAGAGIRGELPGARRRSAGGL